MLVLTRKEGESIMIGDNIFIRFLKCDRGVTKVGIDAPREVHILRTELPFGRDKGEVK